MDEGLMREMDGQEDGPEESVLDRLTREDGDPELFPPEVRRLWEQGKGRKARKALLRAAKSERRQDRARRQVQHAGDFRLWLEPLGSAPGMYTLNGVGSHLYGKYQPEDDGSYIATLWFVFVFIPIWPFSSYLVTKAESGGWHFFARSPRPPSAKMMQRLVIAAFVALAGLGAMAVYDSGTHADVLVYNGFEQPVDVTLAEETRRVGAKQHATFADLVAEPTQMSAAFADSAAFESLDVDLSSHARDTVIYNVGGRGLLSMDYVRYGKGEPKEGRWLEGGPVIFLKEDIDYPFGQPPESKEIREGGYVENSVLSAADRDFDELNLISILLSHGNAEQARQFGLAILREHPENADIALVIARAAMDDPEEQRQLFRGLLERAPDAVDLHRFYQDLWPDDDNQVVVDEYRALLDGHPESAMHHYLVGRLDPESAVERYREAMRLDPSFDKPHLALGYHVAGLGRLDEAKEHYENYAAFGTQQALEVADTRFRLARATKGSPASLEALLAESPTSEDSFRFDRQRLHLRLSADPSRLDQSIQELEALSQEDFGLEPGAPELAGARADLAITAGDLDRARTELATAATVGDLAPWVAFRLALSDGATDQDVERLTSSGNEWLDALTLSQRLAGLGFVDAETRARSLDDVRATPLAALADLLAEPDALRDVKKVESVIGSLPVDERCAAYLAAAQALSLADDAASRRARRDYLERARAFSVPGELPHLRL